HQLGEHLGAADDGNAALLGGFEFRIAGFHRARDHERGGAVEIGWVMANQAADVTGAQALEIGAVLEVAALECVAAGMHHLGDGAHANAAYADDMHEAGLLRIGHVHDERYSLDFTSSSTRSASRFTASTVPIPCDFSAAAL